MIAKALRWIAGVALGGKLLTVVNGINKKLTGVRSEILLGLLGLLWTLRHFGLVGAEADALITAILGALPVTLAEKAKNAVEAANDIVPKPQPPAA